MGEAEGYDYVVVGGGVAGTCLAGEVCRNRPSASICLISPSEILKTIKIVKRITDNLDELTVIEQPVGSFDNSSLEFIQDYVSALVPEEKVVVYDAINTALEPNVLRGLNGGEDMFSE